MLSRRVKNANIEQVRAVDDANVRIAVCKLARDAFEALGARDYGRIDIRMDGDGVPHFLEANLYPSLAGGYGSFPKAYELNARLEYKQMILSIAELGIARSADDTEELPTMFGELVTA
jgi:D-alanine-D-alanine ligase